MAALGAAVDPSLMMRRSARRAGLSVDVLASPPGSCEKPVRLGARIQDAQPAATEPGPPQPAAEAPVSEHRAPSAAPVTGSAAVQGRDAGPAVSQCKRSRARKRKCAGQQTAAKPDSAPSVPALRQPGSALEGETPAAPGADVHAQLPEGEPSATKRQRTRLQQVIGGRVPGQPACSQDSMSAAELSANSRQQPGCGGAEVPPQPLDAQGRQLPGRRGDEEEVALRQLAALRRQLPGDVPLGQLAAAQQLLTSAEAARHSMARCGEPRRHSNDLAGHALEGGMAPQASHVRLAIAQCRGGAASSVAQAAPPAAAAEHGQAQGAAAGAAPPASHAAAAAQEHSRLQGAPTAAAATREPGQAEWPPAATAPSPDQLPACNTIAAGHTPAHGLRNRKGEKEGREGAAAHSEEATPIGKLDFGSGCGSIRFEFVLIGPQLRGPR